MKANVNVRPKETGLKSRVGHGKEKSTPRQCMADSESGAGSAITFENYSGNVADRI